MNCDKHGVFDFCVQLCYHLLINRSVVLIIQVINTMQLDTNNHSVFMLHYHLIMCVKYRNKVIDDEISIRLEEIFVRIAPTYNITLEEWNHDVDHVHILFRGQPNTEISKFINAYKSASSRIIKKEFPMIRKSLWKEMFWSQSFCLLTTGGATVDIIRQYIQSQGKKDGKQGN
jgi:putative transposase